MNYIKSFILFTSLGLSLLSCKKENSELKNDGASSTTSVENDSAKVTSENESSQNDNDTLIVQKALNDYGEEYYPYTENYIIANEVFVRSKPDKNAKKIKSLYFGDKVWVDYSESTNEYNKVYFTKPVVGKPAPKAYYVFESTLVDLYTFKEDYKTNFSLKPFSELHSGVKKIILDNRYADNTHFQLTQNSERAKDVIAYGDFDGDKINDIAILIDNIERQSSRLLVLCTNAATKQPYLAYSATYVDKLKVHAFNKGDKIFMDYDYLEPSPLDGIMLTGEGVKGAIVYNKDTQKFEMYGQLREKG